MTGRKINEEDVLVFVRGALEVLANNYERILAQRTSGTREGLTVKKKNLQREIAEYHRRLGELIERAGQ